MRYVMRWACARNKRPREDRVLDRNQRIALLMQSLDERILLLDGAMGTMIQGFGLSEDDYRGDRFADGPVRLTSRQVHLEILRETML